MNRNAISSTAHQLGEPAMAEARRRADQRAAKEWLTHMLQGDFESAWKESDAIRARGAFDPHRFWDGEPLDGARVMVRCLHGLGDAVQFLRYAEQLGRVAREVVVEVPPALLELAPCIRGVEKAVSWSECDPVNSPRWDKQIEVMELPYYFRTTLDDLPVAEKYLCIPGEARMRLARAMGPGRMPRVGVVWAAGEWNRTRSLPFAELKRLFVTRGCEFWNLQGGTDHDAWSELQNVPALRDAAACGVGVVALASTICEMDLVITVDTLAAHLTGAMGKPGWVLLQHRADWRWMNGTRNSPWYPTLRLFRQPAENDWRGLVGAVADELPRFLRSLQTSGSGN